MIGFRKLEDKEEDYLLMVKWLNNTEVRLWYGWDDFDNGPDLEGIRRKYKKKILNSENDNPNIILIDDIPVGYIQYYHTMEYLAEKNVYGIDLFIGDDRCRGQGYGDKILRLIVNKIFLEVDAEKVIVDPNIKNLRAIKSYIKAGFKKIKEEQGKIIMGINKSLR